MVSPAWNMGSRNLRSSRPAPGRLRRKLGSKCPAGCRMLPESASPRDGTAAKPLLEFAGEMELVPEPRSRANLRNRKARVQQQIGRHLQSLGIELLRGGRVAGEPAQLEQMLPRGPGCARHIVQGEGARIRLPDESLHTPQRRLTLLNRLSPFADRIGKVTQDGHPKRLDDPRMQKLSVCRRGNRLPHQIEQRGHTPEEGKRSPELRKFSPQIRVQYLRPDRDPAMSRLAVSRKVELLQMTGTEKNRLVLSHLQYFVIQLQGQRAAMDHHELVVRLPARSEAAPLGVENISNRHAAELHPGVGDRQAPGLGKHSVNPASIASGNRKPARGYLCKLAHRGKVAASSSPPDSPGIYNLSLQPLSTARPEAQNDVVPAVLDRHRQDGPIMLKGDSNKRTGGQRMVLSLVRHLWGVDLSRGYRNHLAGWRKIGYTAIESSPRAVPDPQELYGVLQSEGLAWIPQVFSQMFVGGGNVALHLASLREQIQECLPASPLFFNAHSGSDAWTLDEAEEFYLRVAELETEMRVTISHETHRSRYFGNPWNTMRLLERVPGVKLTCDFSHWVCVAERLLGDAAGVFTRAARNCHHLHARVGYEQGPQVSDPRAPEWKQHLLAHERWWTLVWQTRAAMGMHEITLTPEFGPFPYLQTLPYTRQPVADLSEICDWMAERQSARFAAWQRGESTSPSGPRQVEAHGNH
jgi:hypothetical protein